MNNYYDSQTFGTDQEFRMAYATHVYRTVQTLFLQFLFTFGCVALVTFNQYVFNFVVQNLATLIISGLCGVWFIVFNMIMSSRKTETQLVGFTIFETQLICAVSVFYGQDVVVLAMLGMFGLVMGLGVYALITPTDHTGMFGTLMSGLSCLMCMNLFNIFFNFQVLHMVELYLGTVIFLGYIIVDVQMFLTEKSAKAAYVQPDLHIIAALNIYLDGINVFLRLLEIISIIKGNKIGKRDPSKRE